MWATDDKYGNSMKWHLALPETLEEREVEEGYGQYTHIKKRKFIHICCAHKDHDLHLAHQDDRFYPYLRRVVVKDKINIMQNNVCSYCKRWVLAQEDIDITLIRQER